MDCPIDTFDSTFFAQLAACEPGHFWFEERNKLIQWCLAKYAPRAGNFCEVGCGTGFVLAGIESARPDLQLTGADCYSEALTHANRRLKFTRLIRADIRQLPFRREFDAVGCFDVLEHIPEDSLALENLARSLRPGGTLLLAVPQHPGLWSVADEMGHHRRRYTRGQLRALVEKSGLVCRFLTSFMTFLLPVVWVRRSTARGASDVMAELRPSAFSNAIGRAFLRLERGLIAHGVSLPVGSSLLVVAEKPSV